MANSPYACTECVDHIASAQALNGSLRRMLFRAKRSTPLRYWTKTLQLRMSQVPHCNVEDSSKIRTTHQIWGLSMSACPWSRNARLLCIEPENRGVFYARQLNSISSAGTNPRRQYAAQMSEPSLEVLLICSLCLLIR